MIIWILGIIGAVVGAVTLHPLVILLAIAPVYATVKRLRSDP